MPQPVPKTIPNQNQGLAVKYIAAKDPQIIPSAMARWDCASVMIAPAKPRLLPLNRGRSRRRQPVHPALPKADGLRRPVAGHRNVLGCRWLWILRNEIEFFQDLIYLWRRRRPQQRDGGDGEGRSAPTLVRPGSQRDAALP